jgi:hypothetical protein
MSFFKKRKIEKVRAEIVNDAELLPEQKEQALARLNQKERELFYTDKIAQQSQSISENMLPLIVGRVQLKRLKTRNEMIREMRITLNELAETKKSWERLKNIDAEIAVEQALAYQAQVEKEAKHAKTMVGLKFGKKEIEQKMERTDLWHAVEKLKLEMELEVLKKKRDEGPPKEKTLEEKTKELEGQLVLDKKEIEGALLLKQIKQDFDQAVEHKGNESLKLEIYERLRNNFKTLLDQGVENETVSKLQKILDREFGFDRVEED